MSSLALIFSLVRLLTLATQRLPVKGLSRTLIIDGIRANVVSPGPVYSEDGIWGKVRTEDPEAFAKKVAQIPFGRMGTPE